MNITLRQATNEDINWLDGFYEKLMRPYVELTHDWNKKKFKESFNPKTTKIIQCDTQDIGMLKTEKKEDCWYIGDIQILETYQGNGFGTSLIQDVIERAKKDELPVRLRVLKGNPAKNLYHRLGFIEICELDNSYELEFKVEKNKNYRRSITLLYRTITRKRIV